MTEIVKKLRVFVASPSDVAAERAHVQEAIGELNRTDGQAKGYVLDLVRWETNSHPSMGRPQSLINSQLGNYDIFIGIMWKRFGSPTGKANSGTEEEFKRAFSIWERNKSLPILFYFCTQPFYPQNDDEYAQMGRVLKFRSELNSLGLTWSYRSADEFLPILREHLARVVNEFLHKFDKPDGVISKPEDDWAKPNEQEMNVDQDDPASRCALALAFGKKISPINSVDMHSRFRQALVAALVNRERLSAEAIVPVPHAGVFLASCWSELRSEQLWLAFGHSRYGSSMFRMPMNQKSRIEHAKQKVGEIVEDGRASKVFLIDEAVLSGTTIATAISTLRRYGVQHVYVRTLVSPVISKCPFDVTTYEPGHGFDAGWRGTPDDFAMVAKALNADNYACLRTETIVDLGAPRSLCVKCLPIG